MAGSKPLWRTFTWANQSCGPCTNTAFLKNYVRGGNAEFGGIDRVEVGTNDITDFKGLLKGVENLPLVRERFSQITTNCRNAQQDILETFLDRGELERLRQPTADLYPRVLQILGCSPEEYKLNLLRYDLSKLRAKELVEKIPNPTVTSSLGKDTVSASST
jgi:hypothetical protein